MRLTWMISSSSKGRFSTVQSIHPDKRSRTASTTRARFPYHLQSLITISTRTATTASPKSHPEPLTPSFKTSTVLKSPILRRLTRTNMRGTCINATAATATMSASTSTESIRTCTPRVSDATTKPTSNNALAAAPICTCTITNTARFSSQTLIWNETTAAQATELSLSKPTTDMKLPRTRSEKVRASKAHLGATILT